MNTKMSRPDAEEQNFVTWERDVEKIIKVLLQSEENMYLVFRKRIGLQILKVGLNFKLLWILR